jgi:hypothetical protein
MKKNKLYLFISILALVILLAIAATCNMCGFGITPTATSDTTAVSETSLEASSGTADISETAVETSSENVAKITEAATESLTTASATETVANKGEVPTIKLTIYEGPSYSIKYNVCYYRIEATVTGDPEPVVEFSRDDMQGTLGTNKIQINLTDKKPNYTLTAKAKNSSGEAATTLDLVYGCIKPVEKTVWLNPSDLGMVSPTNSNDYAILIGVDQDLEDMRGRFAFDVNSLAGKNITYANLRLSVAATSPDPVNFKGPILIYYNDFLPDITISDYYNNNVYGGPETFAWNTDPIEFSNDFLINKIKERANAGIKLQFGIGFENPDPPLTVSSYLGYDSIHIVLTVKYVE